MFVDLKAAFDIMDRRVLIEDMRKKGLRKGLVERVQELLKKTKSRVRVGEEIGEEFLTTRRIRQGRPLSPLFNMLADMEKEMRK